MTSIFSKCKAVLKRLPAVYYAYRLIKQPVKELKAWLEYWRMRRAYAGILDAKPLVRQKGKVLVVSLLGDFVAGAHIDSYLIKGLELGGLKPFIVTTRGAWVNLYYKLFGFHQFVYWEDYLGRAAQQVGDHEADKAVEGFRSFKDLLNYQYQGVAVGKYVCSSLVRGTHAGDIDLFAPATRLLIKSALHQAFLSVWSAREIFDSLKPDTSFFIERGYSPFGECFEVSLQRRVNTIQWCATHRDDAITLKRYTSLDRTGHPISISPATWNAIKDLPWPETRAVEARKELFKSYSTGSWFSIMGTQFNTKVMQANEVKTLLGLDPAKKTAFVFSHLFWDATFFYGEDIFASYQEWFIETVKAACANDKVNWVLKLHPANIVKLNRDSYTGELVEKLAIRKHIGELPKHIKLLEPNTPVNTYSLFEIMDYCLTVRGTIGIESALFGIPVLTAGTGRYDRHGFTIDSTDREEYFGRLKDIQNYPRSTPEQIELAQKFAYGTFILRPFPLKTIRISYKKDKVATQEVDYLVRSHQELQEAADLKAFSRWVLDSRDEDYLNEMVTAEQ